MPLYVETSFSNSAIRSSRLYHASRAESFGAISRSMVRILSILFINTHIAMNLFEQAPYPEKTPEIQPQDFLQFLYAQHDID